jgi:transcription elongation factor Elf1
MPFEFTCPFCHHRTKVDDRFAGQAGPCVSCGREVVMPRYNERGMLEVSVYPKKGGNSVAVSGVSLSKSGAWCHF